MERSSVLNHGLTGSFPSYLCILKALKLLRLRLQFLYKMSRMETEDYQISPKILWFYILFFNNCCSVILRVFHEIFRSTIGSGVGFSFMC